MQHNFRIDAERSPGLREGLGLPTEPGFAQTLIASRQNISPKRLVEPGPDGSQLAAVFEAAAAAPDHGLLCPWRFVLVPAHRREDLAEVFALALLDRDPRDVFQPIPFNRESSSTL